MGLHNELHTEHASAGGDASSYVSAGEFSVTRVERSLQWYEPPALALDEAGLIQQCSESCEELFGYRLPELATQHISALFPQLSGHTLIADGTLNPMLDFLCHCGHPFIGKNRHGVTFKSELNFVRLEHRGRRSLRVIVRPLRNEPASGIPAVGIPGTGFRS